MGHCEEEIRRLIPDELLILFRQILRDVADIRELRLSAACPFIVRTRDRERYIDRQGQWCNTLENAAILTREQIESIFLHICKYSIYAYEDEIRKGYLSVEGGHRIGLTGHVVLTQEGSIQSMKDISGLNIRDRKSTRLNSSH